MSEDFFLTFRESPRPEFTESLYRKLTKETKMQQVTRRTLFVKRVSLACLALILAFALTLVVSPTARAAVFELLAKITVRGTTVFVSDDVPAFSGEGETYSAIWTPIDSSEISLKYPFFAKLPTWIPPGFVLQERAALYGSMDLDVLSSVVVEWKNDRGDVIQINIQKGSCPNGPSYESGAQRSDCRREALFSVGLEAQPQVVAVNDQPAVLFKNYLLLMDLSDPVQKWNPSRATFNNRDPEALFLTWETDEMTFDIAVKSPSVTEEDLLRLAESIP